MTKPTAAPAMNALVEAIRQAAPNVAPNVAAGTEVRTAVRTAVPIEVPIEVREAERIARDSVVVVRCWRRGSRGCPSQRSQKA